MIDHDRRGERRGRRLRLAKARAHRRLTVVERRDGGIGVEMDYRLDLCEFGWMRLLVGTGENIQRTSAGNIVHHV